MMVSMSRQNIPDDTGNRIPGEVRQRESCAVSGRRNLLPALLIACVILVSVWEVMAHRSRGAFHAASISSADFESFAPASAKWTMERRYGVADDPSAPNLYAFVARENGSGGSFPVLVRLVHGYNMPDCMRLKKYSVEKIGDTTNSVGRVQVWRLISAAGDRSVWITTMLRASDLSGTGVEVSEMKFPRITFIDVTDWDTSGLSLSWIRHPVKSVRSYLKARWNDSRCDLAVFLRLKQPPWVSNEYFTFLAASCDVNLPEEEELRAVDRVTSVHSWMYGELIGWRDGNARAMDLFTPGNRK